MHAAVVYKSLYIGSSWVVIKTGRQEMRKCMETEKGV